MPSFCNVHYLIQIAKKKSFNQDTNYVFINVDFLIVKKLIKLGVLEEGS